ncbi:MAG: hypothetical protein GW778_08820 [Alphaproteobacteria bacterium]|nr:hypothetical protein [Alphaproteobacteria bacterium]
MLERHLGALSESFKDAYAVTTAGTLTLTTALATLQNAIGSNVDQDMTVIGGLASLAGATLTAAFAANTSNQFKTSIPGSMLGYTSGTGLGAATGLLITGLVAVGLEELDKPNYQTSSSETYRLLLTQAEMENLDYTFG